MDQNTPATPDSLDTQPISLNDSAEPPISLRSDAYAPPPDEQTINSRSFKAAFGLGDLKEAIRIRQGIQLGEEQSMRENDAALANVQHQQAKNQLVYDLARKKGANLTPEETSFVNSLPATPTGQVYNPDTIWEKKFAQRYVTDTMQSGMSQTTSPVSQSMAQKPDETLNNADAFTSVQESQQAFQKLYEDTAAQSHARGWFKTAFDIASSVTPLVSWYNLWNATKDIPTVSHLQLPGNTIGEVVTHVWSLPKEEQIPAAKEIIERLAQVNPNDALTFAAALVKYSSSDALMNNVTGAFDLASGVGVASKMLRLNRVFRKGEFAEGMAPGPERPAPGVQNAPNAPTPPANLTTIPPAATPGQPQLELFSTGDRTQTEMFPNELFRSQEAPTTESKLPPGKLRSTYVPLGPEKNFGRDIRTGRMYKEPTQKEMNLQQSHQLDLGDWGHAAIEPPKVPPGAKADDPLLEFNTAMSDAVRATDEPRAKPEAILAESGNVDDAAKILVAKKESGMYGLEDALASLPSNMNPSNWLGRGAVIAGEKARRMTAALEKMQADLLQTLAKTPHVPRVTQEARDAGFAATEEQMWREYGSNPRVNDGVLDVLHVPAETFVNNNDMVVFRLGHPIEGGMFPDKAMAEFYLENHYGFGKGEAFPVQQGTQYVIHLAKPVDETMDTVRDLLTTSKNSTPVSFINMLTSRVRSQDALLSKEQNERRKLAQHLPQNLLQTIKTQYNATSSLLTRKERQEVERMLMLNRDEEVNGQRGFFYRNDADFETAFMNANKSMPTANQTAHYFNYVRLHDFDWFVRNLGMYQAKARKGVSQFSLKFRDGEGEVQNLKFFEGKKVDTIPWEGQDAHIAVYDPKTQTLRSTYKHATLNEGVDVSKAELDGLIKKGWEVVQTYNPRGNVLKELGLDQPVNFILAPGFDKRALGWNQLTYQPGVHSIYRDPWYIAQPIVRQGHKGKTLYLGDANAFNFTTEAEAKYFLGHLENARGMLNKNDPALAAHLSRNLGMTEERFRAMFKAGLFDAKTPFSTKREGFNVFETDSDLRARYPEAVNAPKSQWDLSALEDKSFTADRGYVLPSFESFPVVKMTKARQIDPYHALSRAFNQSIGNLWMNDYKVGAIEQWLKEFGSIMRPNSEQLYNAPLYYLYNPSYNRAVDQMKLSAAEANRRAILNFVGQRTELQKRLVYVQNKFMNGIYHALGSNATKMLSDVGLSAIRDPASYLRAVAFHTQLGFFNPVQLMVQAQSMTHAFAVAGPKIGLQALAAATMIRRLAHTENPAIIDRFATMATKFGWGKDEFKEMLQSLKDSGTYHVMGEAALRDSLDPKLFRSTIGRFMDKSTMFFGEGERMVRLVAHAAAYKQVGKATALYKNGVIDSRALGNLLERADLLSVNMTRKSLADFQNGVLGIPLQFGSYQLRMMEQFLGGKLTTAEKLRATAFYSLLYGIPAGVGGTWLGVWPWYDDLRQGAIARGINMHDKWFQALSGGVMDTLINTMLGREYNASQRYAPGNFSAIRDWWRGDKTAGETLGGASGSILGGIIDSTQPLVSDLAALLHGDGQRFPYQPEDITNLFKNIQTFNIGARVANILYYGKYYSKNEALMSDRMIPMDSAMAMLGLTPQMVQDALQARGAGKYDKTIADDQGKLILDQYRLATLALQDHDEKKYEAYMRRAQYLVDAGNFTPDEKSRLWQRGLAYAEPLDRQAMYDYMVRRARPDHAIDKYNSYFQNYQQPY